MKSYKMNGNSSHSDPVSFQYFFFYTIQSALELGAVNQSTRTSLEVKQKPSVAEVKMRQVTILLKMLKHFWVKNLWGIKQNNV